MKKKFKKKQIWIFKIGAMVFFSFALVTTFQNCSAINIQGRQSSSVQDSTIGLAKGEWDLCPSTNLYKSFDFFDKVPKPSSQDIGPMGNGNTLVVKFIPNPIPNTGCTHCPPRHPSGSNLSAFFSPAYGGPQTRDWSISKTACDFSAAGAVTNYAGKKLSGRTEFGDIEFNYNYGPPGSGATFIYGETYYLNIYGVSGCATGDCHMGPIKWE